MRPAFSTIRFETLILLRFRQVPVTEELVNRVRGGIQFLPIVIKKYIPQVENPDRYLDDGLVPLANRMVVMQTFSVSKAFKATLVSRFHVYLSALILIGCSGC